MRNLRAFPLMFVLLAFPAMLFQACQTTTQTLVTQIAVQLATERVVKNDPVKAAKAVAIARQIEELAAGDEATTLDALFLLVNTRIDWLRLTPAEATGVSLLLGAVRTELETRMSAGEIPVDQLWRVALVAAWIRQAAAPYAVSS